MALGELQEHNELWFTRLYVSALAFQAGPETAMRSVVCTHFHSGKNRGSRSPCARRLPQRRPHARGRDVESSRARAPAWHPDANGHLSPGASPAAASSDIENFWKPDSHRKDPSPPPAPTGSYLSTPKPAPPPLAQRRPSPRPRPAPDQDGGRRGHSGRCVHAGPLPQMPPDWEPAEPRRVVPEAWSRLPAKPPAKTILGPDISGAWESYLKRRIWSPVTIKIAPPERSGSPWASSGPGARSVGRPPSEERPDPYAKETVLRTLSQSKKGNRKFDGPLWFEIPESRSRRRNPELRPSAFKPLIKNGVVPSFVPRPGPLDRSLRSWSHSSCEEQTDPGPDVQRSLSAAHPPAGTAPAQATAPLLESWEKTQHSWGPGPPPVHNSTASRVSFAPEEPQPADPFDS
ncbi:hypothetical protein HPG69_012154 [Diceros bicornis minor]|uniref:POM121-like protein 12 n=1 Tax=Diceros bicornis minor TaxID=77932 RepID=A0A7J7ELY0_DICBM|nr:hypothetical protein HPG69_012154 [Diceros bicornis minor]